MRAAKLKNAKPKGKYVYDTYANLKIFLFEILQDQKIIEGRLDINPTNSEGNLKNLKPVVE